MAIRTLSLPYSRPITQVILGRYDLPFSAVLKARLDVETQFNGFETLMEGAFDVDCARKTSSNRVSIVLI